MKKEDLGKAGVRVSGKSGGRTVPVSPGVAGLLAAQGDDRGMWIGRQGEFTRSGLQQIVRRTMKRAGLDYKEKIGPHTLRHTFGVQYNMNGGDIPTLKSIMGHSKIESTMQYLIISNRLVESQHRKASPMANIAGPKVAEFCENDANEQTLSPDSHQGKSASTKVMTLPISSVEEFEMILALPEAERESLIHQYRRQNENERMLSPDSHQGKPATSKLMTLPITSVEEFEMILALPKAERESLIHQYRRQNENERMLSPDSHQGKPATSKLMTLPISSVEEFEMILALPKAQRKRLIHQYRRQTGRPVENAKRPSTLTIIRDFITS